MTWYSFPPLIFITVAQHETAVVLWFRLLTPYFDGWWPPAWITFVTVSVIDLIWLYLLFFVFRASLTKISHWPRIQTFLENLQQKHWFHKIASLFVKSEVVSIHKESKFKTFIRNSGYLGIFLCGSIPGPGIKEIGIVMALTPKYKDRGFWLIYGGGLIKTTMTLLVYGGIYHAIESLIFA